MKIVFLGSGPFALPILERLSAPAADCSLARVISRPDRPTKKRGRALTPTEVKSRCAELGIACETPPTVNAAEVREELEALAPDLVLVADYGEILRAPFLAIPRIGVFNVHGSILPRHRGAAPVVHAILAGDERTGVTLFRIEEGLDSGPILGTKETAIRADDTAESLEARLAELGGELVAELLPALAAGAFTEEPQDSSLATYAPKITKEMGRIDWTRDAADIARQVRALEAFTVRPEIKGRAERVSILRASAADPSAGSGDAGGESAEREPGVVATRDRRGFTVACGSGTELRVERLKREGKSDVDAKAFLNGCPLAPGDVFGVTEGAS